MRLLASAPPETPDPLGELTALPQKHRSWIKGEGEGGRERREGGERGDEEKGKDPPVSEVR